MKQTEAKRYCTVSSAAKALEVSPSTIWRWVEACRLPSYRVGPKRIRIKKEDLDCVIQPVRPDEEARDMLAALVKPPTPEELARRKALVAESLGHRNECNIAPLTTADLVRLVRDGEPNPWLH